MSFSAGANGWLRRGAAALALLLLASACNQRSQPPSMVVILVDTMRADYLGAYGFAAPTTPNLDALAKESVVFERAYAQAPWTKPSVASLFTSLYPSQHQVLSHDGQFGDQTDRARYADALSDQALTLAEVLKGAGYETAAFVANPWVQRRLGFGQGFEVFDGRGSGKRLLADEVFGRVRDWLGRRDRQHPFLLYVHLMDVHGPYDAPQEDFDALQSVQEAFGRSRRLTPEELSQIRRYLLTPTWTREPFSDRPEVWRGHYAAGVHRADRAIGSFLGELKNAGDLDASVVVVTSDHGEELLDHGSWDHGHRLFEEQIHVPLIMRLPDGRGAGTRVSEVVSLIDLMPTLVALAGLPEPAGMQGRSLLPLLEDSRDRNAEDETYASGVKWDPEATSIRHGRYKLIVGGQGKAPRLYDLETDPHELQDIAALQPTVLADLSLRLARHQASLAAAGVLPRATAVISEEMRRRLDALGYTARDQDKQGGDAAGGAGKEKEPGTEAGTAGPAERSDDAGGAADDDGAADEKGARERSGQKEDSHPPADVDEPSDVGSDAPSNQEPAESDVSPPAPR